MSDPMPILIPLLNPNEPEAILAELRIREGDWVQAGDTLGTLETTKSTAELIAESSGFVVGLTAQTGQLVRAGEPLCYLADSAAEVNMPAPPPGAEEPTSLPAGLRITQPALALAKSLGVDLSQLPIGPLVTESMVRQLHDETSAETQSKSLEATPAAFDPTAMLIYGGGGHGKSLIDLVRSLGTYRLVGIIDDGLEVNTTILGLPVLGGGEVLPDFYAKGIRLALNAVGGIGNLAVRLQVAQRLAQAGFVTPTVVHPRAVVEPSAQLSSGVQVFALAYIGSEVRIGSGAIINTGAIVSHECTIGDFANLSPGAILAGQVQIGAGALIGMGATINLQVRIGANARVGNGATVKSDVPDGGIVRAGSIWPN